MVALLWSHKEQGVQETWVTQDPQYPSGSNYINKQNNQAKTNILDNHKAK